MAAIITTYVPGDVPHIKATCYGYTIERGFDPDLSTTENHWQAAKELIETYMPALLKFEWRGSKVAIGVCAFVMTSTSVAFRG